MPQAGDLLAGRYEIIEMLGKGGMGAVLKARDRELDRLVAIKVIRPELAEDAEALQRFKQELILARQITHRNVVRIYDLGQSEGLKFITMEFVEGKDLKQLLAERGKIPADEAATIVAQICRALDAAHKEGVIHRDLKPQNIMLDRQNRVIVMDFGIARSLEVPGRTQTGTLIGTPDYMSPEQAKGEKVDTRSDLFSLGIIFYELLTGKSPYQADTAMGTLLRRIQERAIPPSEIDAAVPVSLSNIVVKCLAPNREERYQTAREIRKDLEVGRDPGSAATAVAPAPTLPGIPASAATGQLPPAPGGPPARAGRPKRARWLIAAGALMLAVLGTALFLLKDRWLPDRAKGTPPVTVLVADFENSTSEEVFDNTIESTFTLALEGASFISSYRRGDARKAATQLKKDAERLDENVARLVAVREGINVVIAGSMARSGNGYLLSVRAIDAVVGRVIASRDARPGNKDEVLPAVSRLAASIRQSLGDATPESAQLAALETFSASSIESVHEYARAQELQWAGKAEDAVRAYQKAIALDPNLSRAYAGLAAVSANIGRQKDSEQYYQQAMSRVDRMSEREKFRTLGGYYMATRNPDKAIEVLSEMVKKYPADSSGFSNLAYAYSLRRELPKALEFGKKAVEIYPKNLIQRNNVAIYAMYAGDFEEARKQARGVLEANPAFVKAHVVAALCEIALGRPEQAAQQYRTLEKVSALGASAAAAGLADLATYEGRVADAAGIATAAAEADLAAGNKTAAANKYLLLASARLLAGGKAQAAAAADKARELDTSETLRFELGRIYAAAGQESKARELAIGLGGQILAEPQAYGKIIEGEIVLNRGTAKEAARLFLEAQKLVDTWYGRYALGRAYLGTDSFTEAHSELELCVRRRGEATALFLDEVPTFRVFPPVYFYLGRAHDGLKSTDAADSYKSYIAIRQNGIADKMLADARRFLAGR
jgi:eukaryotic-like serine/threonine-protein kinase